MFISFGMYILLIILTIIMIALIIYLTMTASKNSSSPKKYDPETEEKIRLSQHEEQNKTHTLPTKTR